MPILPSRFATVSLHFAPLFYHRGWRHAEVLLIGAILAPGRRTVASLLRIRGLMRERHFVNCHRVLNRAAWSPLLVSRLLLRLLIETFAPNGPVVLGLDDTIERRRGKRIAAKGIHRDPVRSSHGHFVKASGLRWLSVMLLVPIPRAERIRAERIRAERIRAERIRAERIRALPFLTALAPSERYNREHGRRHKKLTEWGRQVVLQVRRWLPGRNLVLVADSSFAAPGSSPGQALDFPAAPVCHGVVCITRLRLDAALYDPAPPRLPGTLGRPRTKGKRLANLSQVLVDAGTLWRHALVPGWYGGGERAVDLCSGTAVWRHAGLPVVPIRWVLVRDPLGRFDPQALLCTDPNQDPHQVVRWFVQRWQVETTFQETRAHPGVETQRQWSDRAIARTTPCLLGLFSLVTLLAAQLSPTARGAVMSAAWYHKRRPTFSDTLAAVRRHFWQEQGFAMSRHPGEAKKLRSALQEGITYALCHAA